MTSKTVLAFDLSLSNSGWAVGTVENEKLVNIEFGSIGTKRWASQGTGKRLHYIYEKVGNLLDGFKPDEIVKERSFSNGRIKATQQIFKVNGIWEMGLYRAYYPEFTEYAPTTVKKQLTGNGRAKKQAVRDAVETFIGQKTSNDDQSDAVAVLITHCIKEKLITV